MNTFNKTKFNLAEVFNNESGKSSGSAFVGVIGSLFIMIIMTVIIVLLYLLRDQTGANVTLIINSFQSALLGLFTLATMYAALLGLRKFVSKNSKENIETNIGSDDKNNNSDSQTQS